MLDSLIADTMTWLGVGLPTKRIFALFLFFFFLSRTTTTTLSKSNYYIICCNTANIFGALGRLGIFGKPKKQTSQLAHRLDSSGAVRLPPCSHSLTYMAAFCHPHHHLDASGRFAKSITRLVCRSRTNIIRSRRGSHFWLGPFVLAGRTFSNTGLRVHSDCN